jgi:CHRD domain
MKRLSIFILMLACAACDSDSEAPTGPSVSGPIVFTSQLLASNEVPAISNTESAGRGSATITFNVSRDATGNVIGGGTVDFAVQLSGFPVTSAGVAAHIHPGASGVNGPILVPVVGLAATAPILMGDGTVSVIFSGSPITQAQAAQIVANPAGFYFNVHTPLNPGGAARGQMVRVQ